MPKESGQQPPVMPQNLSVVGNQSLQMLRQAVGHPMPKSSVTVDVVHQFGAHVPAEGLQAQAWGQVPQGVGSVAPPAVSRPRIALTLIFLAQLSRAGNLSSQGVVRVQGFSGGRVQCRMLLYLSTLLPVCPCRLTRVLV